MPASRESSPSGPIESAPPDETRIWVFLAGQGTWVEAYWAKQTQAWVRWGDPERRTLRRAMHWREPPPGR
jgi:hypothetical protein